MMPARLPQPPQDSPWLTPHCPPGPATRRTGCRSSAGSGSFAHLRADLEVGLSGAGRVLLLTGEPGIGKTRTAEELASEAATRGASSSGDAVTRRSGRPILALGADLAHLRATPAAGCAPRRAGQWRRRRRPARAGDRHAVAGPAGAPRACSGAGAVPRIRSHRRLSAVRRDGAAARPDPRRPAMGRRSRPCSCWSSWPARQETPRSCSSAHTATSRWVGSIRWRAPWSNWPAPATVSGSRCEG